MPTYQYQCENCGYELEEFQYMSEPPLKHCPKCNTDSLVRIIGTGAGIIFKGTGFYLTDYKKTASPLKTETKKEKGKSEAKPKEEKAGGTSGTAEKK